MDIKYLQKAATNCNMLESTIRMIALDSKINTGSIII